MKHTIRDVIRLARHIHNQAHLTNAGSPWQVCVMPNLFELVRKELREKRGIRDLRVHKLQASDEFDLFYGMAEQGVVRDPAEPVVLIRSRNPCWDRFTVAKELLHLYSAHVNRPGWGDAEKMLKAAHRSRSFVPNETDELDDESFGVFLAVEVMIPWPDRGTLSDLVHEENFTNLQLATRYRIPEAIIEQVLCKPLAGTGPMLNGRMEYGLSYLGLSYRINQEIS